MHSWRVLILPYLEQKALYDSYHFDEPWDSPNNAKLERQIGNVYLRSGLESDRAETTSFVAVVGPQTAWPGSRTTSKDLRDGSHHTLMVVEVPDGLFRWMEPKDLAFGHMCFRINDGSKQGLGSRLGGARVVAADGSVRTLPDGLAPEVLKALLTASAGDSIQGSPFANEAPAE
jgi:hypothetical protein